MSNRSLIVVGLLAIMTALAIQQRSLHKLREEIARMRDTVATPAALPAPMPAPTRSRSVPVATDSTAVNQRLLALEDAVMRLDNSAGYLMDRGQLPPSEAKLAEYRLQFLNPQARTRDRLNALRLLRRNQGLTPEVLQAAAAWMLLDADPSTTRSLLEILSGVSNDALFNATYQLAASNKDNRVREMAIRNLPSFVSHPEVETLLRTVASSDSNADLRRHAAGALQRLPMNEQRLFDLRQQALDLNTPLDQRALSLQLMHQARADVSDVALSLAQSAQTEADKARRLQYLQMFDDVTHPAFLPSIVQGVQDSDPDIRVRAADALRDYRNDATALQWLQYLAQSDPDERVRREAAQAFPQNRGRRGP